MIKQNARATFDLMSKSLNLEATLKKATFVNGNLTTDPSNGGNTSGGDESNGD